MRLATLASATGPRAAVVADDGYIDIQATDAGLPCSVQEWLSQPAGERRAALARVIARGRPVAGEAVRLLPPLVAPRKIICVGLNYADHARESGVEPPPEPVLFNKFPTALIAHEQPIVLPKVSHEVDYEAELVVVVGRRGRDIARAQAWEYVAGYTLGNDVSARDWQMGKPGRQWLLGKTFDTFAPTGPHVVTADALDPGALAVRFRLNGDTLQDSNSRELIFKIDELVAYISQVCTLEPGDLIFTGTPPGVGFARKPPIFLKPGDLCEVEIEGIGVLRNPVVGSYS